MDREPSPSFAQQPVPVWKRRLGWPPIRCSAALPCPRC